MPPTAWMRYVPAVRGPQPEEPFVAPPPPSRVAVMTVVDPSPGRSLVVESPVSAMPQLTRVPAGRPHRRH